MTDHRLSSSVIRIFESNLKKQKILDTYKCTINNIEEWAEHSGSKRDRKFLQKQIDTLYQNIRDIYTKKSD